MPQPNEDFVGAVLEVVASIPEGRVMSYGDVAAAIGSRAARGVGQVMAYYGSEVPWWRVVRASGHPPQCHEDRALEFYTKKLGFSITTDQPFNDKQRWIELKIPGADTGVVLFTPEGHENRIGSFHSISFYTNDVQKTYDELSSRGVEFLGPPKTADWGTAAIFKDPDGNQFVLGSR